VSRLHKIPGIFHYDQDSGLFFIVPQHDLPFTTAEMKLLPKSRRNFYSGCSYYCNTSEIRFDADDTVLASIASARIAVDLPRKWVTAKVEFLLNGTDRRLQTFVRGFATQEEISERAYLLAAGNPGRSVVDNWLCAEDELLG
jgi:hypothetical protein